MCKQIGNVKSKPVQGRAWRVDKHILVEYKMPCAINDMFVCC